MVAAAFAMRSAALRLCFAIEILGNLFNKHGDKSFKFFLNCSCRGGDVAVAEPVGGYSGGQIGDAAHPANTQAKMIGGDDFRNSAHANGVAPDFHQVSYFGGSFVSGA